MTTPDGLSENSRRLWEATTAAYELETHELIILEQACRELTLIERMEADITSGHLIVKGSMGQPVVNELIKEIRQHRVKYEGSIKALQLPAAEEAAAGARSSSARAAANARWRKAG